jgi:hypothetical protein
MISKYVSYKEERFCAVYNRSFAKFETIILVLNVCVKCQRYL